MSTVITSQLSKNGQTVEITIDAFSSTLKSPELVYSCALTYIESRVYLVLRGYQQDHLFILSSNIWEKIDLPLKRTRIHLSDNYKNIFISSDGIFFCLENNRHKEIFNTSTGQEILYVYGNADDLIIHTTSSRETEYQIFHWNNISLMPIVTSTFLNTVLSTKLSRPFFFSDKERVVDHMFLLNDNTIALIQDANYSNDYVLLNLKTRKKLLRGINYIVFSGKIGDDIFLITSDGQIFSFSLIEREIHMIKTRIKMSSPDKIISIWPDKFGQWILHCRCGIYIYNNNESTKIRSCNYDDSHFAPFSIIIP